MYLVWSAYFGIMEDLIDNKHVKIQGKWMFIWNLKIPLKSEVIYLEGSKGLFSNPCKYSE